MLLKYLSSALGLFLLGNCAGNKPHVEKGNYASGKPKYRVEMDDQNRKHGNEIWWHEGGAKKFETRYEHGVRQGVYKAWYSNGKPWYQGMDEKGLAQDTLTYWYANGYLMTMAVFRDGIQLLRLDFDSTGELAGHPTKPLSKEIQVKPNEDSIRFVRQREKGIQDWSKKVRATVESFWVLPSELLKTPYQSVAKIRVSKMGDVLKVTWVKKSPSKIFNQIAENALKKMKRFPAFSSDIRDNELEIQYEFVTPGRLAPRRKLELRNPNSGAEKDSGQAVDSESEINSPEPF